MKAGDLTMEELKELIRDIVQEELDAFMDALIDELEEMEADDLIVDLEEETDEKGPFLDWEIKRMKGGE